MALKVTGYTSGSMKYKIVYQDAVTQTADVDVLGDGGTVKSLELWNQHSAIIYFKMKRTSGEYTAGSTEPDVMLRMPATTSKQFDFPDGLSFDQLTFWSNDGATTADTDAPGGTVSATFICS